MKKYPAMLILALFVVSACSKNEETPVEQKQKTESTITGVIDEGEKIQSSNALQALESMPDDAPIESSFPVGTTGKSTFADMVTSHIPFLKRNIAKSPLDSIAGTWEYDESTDEWNHTSNEPADGIVLIWNYQDTAGVNHQARFEFKTPQWYNDTLLVRFDADLYVDNQKVAHTHYELTIQNDLPTRLVLNGAIVGIVDFSIDISLADGHSLEDDDFYGTVHISFNDLEEGTSYVLDITINEDDSGSFKLVMNDNGDHWKFYAAVSAPDSATGAQRVSGYIKYNNEETARIEGTLVDGNFSEIYVIYADGTRVSLSEYLAGVDIGD